MIYKFLIEKYINTFRKKMNILHKLENFCKDNIEEKQL